MTAPAHRGVLDAVVRLAQQAVSGAAGASVTLVTSSGATTAAASAGWASELDRVQYALGSGPCVDAALGGEVREVTDATAETRWPSYAGAAVAAAALSSLSMPIPSGDDDTVGSLNVFGRAPGAFGPADHRTMQRLAGIAGTALSPPAESGRGSAAGALVEQAKGILMSAGCSAPEALDQLGRTAAASSRSVRDVAGDLVRSTIQQS